MRRSNKRPLVYLFLIIVALLVIGFFGFQSYKNYLNSPLDPNGKVKMFIINPGENPPEVAKRLVEEGFIRSSWAFLQALKSKEDQTIEAGDFKLSPKMDVNEIIENLQQGSVDKRITLLEGWRVEEMAQELEDELGIEKGEFLSLAEEGYMFPDTYFFNPEATADTVVNTLKGTFNSRFTSDLKQKIASQGLSEKEAVILASLVEREARSDKVRTEVASIILKRYKMGMKLDIDATVRYAMDTEEYKRRGKVDKYWQSITQADYQDVKSPYNTYLNSGLPPTPICNPSLSSLKAIANADPNTPYLFYYHDSSGNTYYGKTLEEHNRNIQNN
jgi:UPF0755 protein